MDDTTLPFLPGAASDASAQQAGVAAWDATTVSDTPTQIIPRKPTGAPHGAPDFERKLRRRMSSRPRRISEGRGPLIAAVSMGLLLILGIPILVALVGATRDYTTLKSLGESGMAHLLAVKGDLTGQPSSGSGSSSSSSSLPSLSGSGKTASLLATLDGLLATPGPDVTNPAYTYLAQRQGGTFNPLTVTVRPAKGVSAEGTKTATFTTTLTGPTYFALGGQPKATPTPAPATTATPAATPTASAGGTTSGGKTSIFPDPQRIAAAEVDLRAAQQDFQSLADRLDHPDTTLALAAMLPVAGDDIRAVESLSHVGIDVAQAGLVMLSAATPLLTRLHGSSGSLLSGSQQLITQADITALQAAMTIAAAKLTDAATRLKSVDLNALPISAHQKAMVAQVMPLLPQVTTLLPQASSLIGVAGWLLGVGQPRHFLVQTLDRGEMRATGGFTGQYGILTLTDGKLAPFSLQDVNCLDYLTGCLSNGWIFGRRPPAPYNTWWPFGNWGLRDSNLSADFPTNAKLVMNVYYHESGQQVDGLIDVSPIAIEDVLRVTGPIQVPLYNETVTADNLEAKLHYYQQDPAAIAKEKQISSGNTSTSTRKQFTQLVGQLLQERVKTLPMSEMGPLAKQMLLDMRSKDLQVYLTNPAAEKLLTQIHADGSVNTTPGTDGFLLVQSNTSVSKATSFVKMTQRDDVTLDAKGGATHHLKLTFSANYVYNQIYGYLTYRDYLRIYVPPQAKLLSANGFDTGKPLCWSPYYGYGSKEPAIFKDVPLCTGNPYTQGELVCPSGSFAPGPQAPNNPTKENPIASNGYTAWASDQLGMPPNTTSDLPDRAMYAGYVVVPDYCTATVTLSWYVPGVAAK